MERALGQNDRYIDLVLLTHPHRLSVRRPAIDQYLHRAEVYQLAIPLPDVEKPE
jgi:hypothetical protein